MISSRTLESFWRAPIICLAGLRGEQAVTMFAIIFPHVARLLPLCGVANPFLAGKRPCRIFLNYTYQEIQCRRLHLELSLAHLKLLIEVPVTPQSSQYDDHRKMWMNLCYLLCDDATQAMTDKHNGSPHFLADISIFYGYDENSV